MWLMEQKTILSRCRTDNRDEPTRPDAIKTSRSLTPYNSVCLIWEFQIFTVGLDTVQVCRIEFSSDFIGWIGNDSYFSEY